MSFLLPDAGLLFWMLIVFGIVFFVLAKFAYPVIIGAIDERKRLIDDSVKNAREVKERLVAVNSESEALLRAARDEQAKILREAAAMREELIKDARDRAEKESEKIMEETRRLIRAEKEDAVREVRRTVAVLSVEIAEKILRRELSQENKQYSVIENLVDESFSNK